MSGSCLQIIFIYHNIVLKQGEGEGELSSYFRAKATKMEYSTF